jgi:hypothetical protein
VTVRLTAKEVVPGLVERSGSRTDLAPVSPDEPARILQKVFFTPKDFEQGVLYGFRD